MIQKLKLIQLVMMCLIVTCILGLSSFAQSPTSQKGVQSESFNFVEYQRQLAELEKLNKIEQSVLAKPLTNQIADKLESIKIRREKIESELANAPIQKKSTTLINKNVRLDGGTKNQQIQQVNIPVMPKKSEVNSQN